MQRFSTRLSCFIILAICGAVTPASAQQKTIFDAFRSIFQSPKSPQVIEIPQGQPRKIRKPPAAKRPIPRAQPKIIPAVTLYPDTAGVPGGLMPFAGAKPAPEQPAAPVAAEPVKPAFFVQVLGDSIGQLLAQGLVQALADRPDIAVVKRAKESSGLVRDDFYNWPKTSRELLAGTEVTDIAVIMLGSNDHQPFYGKDGKILADLGSEEWLKLYRARAEEEAAAFKDKHIKLIWVGMPIMRSDKFAADMSQLNEIFRDVATQSGATYVDIWSAFADDKGEFSATGPDITGQQTRLRTADGIHFTSAGQRKLASFLEKDIRRAYDAKKQAEAPALAVSPVEPVPPAETPAPLPQPFEPVKVERPISGPISSLTTPPSAANGELVSTLAKRKPLTRNEPDDTEPHPSRADNFIWPLQ